jgi:DNA invertase Pin-like site-specific DNA recombinase
MGRLPLNIVYTRVSTERQEHALQVAEIERALGGKADRLYQDTGSAFKKAPRPGLDSLLRHAEAGILRGGTVWIFALSRLSRRGTRDVIDTIHRLETSGVAIRSVTEPMIDTTQGNAFRDVIVSMFAVVAKLESTAKADRTKAWHALKRERGERTGRRPRAIDAEKLRVMRDRGESIGAMSRAFGCARNTLRKALSKLA